VKGVRYISFAEHSGYGISAQGYMRALLRLGVELQWVPLVATPSGYSPWNAVEHASRWITGLADERTPEGDFGPEILATIEAQPKCDSSILHCTPEHWPHYLDSKTTNFGYTVWETDTPPAHWLTLLESVDQILVPSEFTRTVFEDAGIRRPIRLVPHIAAPNTVPPSAEQESSFRRRHDIAEQHFLFYAIEAWTARKALWKTIHAFLQAFTANDPVSLVVKTGPTGPRSGAAPDTTSTQELVQELLSHYHHAPPVVLIGERLEAADIDLLHHTADCYLSLTYSEGWGLGAFQAGAFGNPVIITGWGGHLDYLGTDWPYLISYELTPVMDALGRQSYQPTQRWAAPHMDHAVELVREVYRDQTRARSLGTALGIRIRRDFDERVVGRRLVDLLNGTVGEHR
jgi:glycosyltransferase involved in cell wall biosynthesis